MRRIARFLVCFFFLLSLFLSFFTGQTSAAGEFGATYDVHYDIDSAGSTFITQKISLENKTTQLYATQFTLTIGAVKVVNPRAFDDVGQLPLKTESSGGNTILTINFSQKVVGKGKKLVLTLTYESPETVTRSGQIWEIGIPKLSSTEGIDAYNVTLVVPKSFGPAVFITPQPRSIEENFSTSKVYHFDRDELVEKGISASFGDRQIYNFNLAYHLQNTNLIPISTEIALPPDNGYQKVYLENIEPKPKDVALDKDGNWIATFHLAPRSKVKVVASGFIETHPQPIASMLEVLSQSEKQAYLLPQKYWDVDNPRLQAKAAELKNPKAIYDFIISYLSYNKGRLQSQNIQRLGAQAAFDDSKNAVCMEFTDLFIALARSAGIPAREVDGFAYSVNDRLRPLSLKNEGDILHAWPEYWDDKLGWVQIDPTWGSTSGGVDFFSKLDFNHITFVQKGYSSQVPYPAGSYKLSGNPNTHDVDVRFAESAPEEMEDVSMIVDLPKETIALLPAGGSVAITNNGSAAFEGGKLTIETKNSSVTPQGEFEIGKVLPYSSKTVWFSLRSNHPFAWTEDEVIFSFGGQKLSRRIIFDPLPSAKVLPLGFGLVTTAVVSAIIVKLLRREKQNVSGSGGKSKKSSP